MHPGKPGLDRAPIDTHCEPPLRRVGAQPRIGRDLRDLLGLVPALLTEGRVVEHEWTRLATWGATHPGAMTTWPVHLIFSRLQLFFADGVIDEAERAELYDLRADLAAGTAVLQLGCDEPPALPLDTPGPLISWAGETFVFTGRFAFGTLSQCEREVLVRRGRVGDRVTTLTNFLVVGSFASRDGVETSYGHKIDDAIGLRRLGLAVHLVGEDHWTAALTRSLDAADEAPPAG